MLVLDDLTFARTVPLRVKRRGLRRGEVTTCACGAAFEEVLITTGGPTGKSETWRAWPLVLDGWRCTKCDATRFPRFLEPEEVVAIGKASIEAANKGLEHEAEFGFRRLVSTWGDYRPALMDLSTVLLARANRLEDEGQMSLSLLDEIEGLLREALGLEPPPSRAVVVQRLAATLLLRDQSALASDLVRDELARPDAERAELEPLARWVKLRGDLYELGSRLVKPVMHFHGAPKPQVDEVVRAKAERGIAALLRHHQANPASWQALWMAAMGRKTLTGARASLELFAQALAVAPGNADVGREYALALLNLEEAPKAVELTRSLVAANPGKADLLANLAVAELLAGDPAAALPHAEAAVALDGADPINRSILKLVRAVLAGERKAPRSLAELERPAG